MNTKFINIGCKTFKVAKQVFFLNSQYSKKDNSFSALIFKSFQPTIELFCFGYMHNQIVSNWIQRYLNIHLSKNMRTQNFVSNICGKRNVIHVKNRPNETHPDSGF